MHSAKQIREMLLVLLGVALTAGSATAQPLTIAFRTIESRVAQTDHVVVGVQDTQVTDAGVAELQAALPKYKIKR